MKYKLNYSSKLISSTPNTHDHSIGFHDVKPFNKNNNHITYVHRYSLQNIGFKKEINSIDICLWNYIENKINPVDSTDAWSWEQGSRTQWLSDNELIYNVKIQDSIKSKIYNIKKNSFYLMENSFYSFNKYNQFLEINYLRLWQLWKSYGYKTEKDKILDKKPKDDGVYIWDLDNNRRLYLSIYEAVKICKLDNVDKHFFLCHPTFNPSGDKFVCILRFFNDSNNLISYLILCDVKNQSNKVIIQEKVSHFEWINDEDIIVWSRKINTKISNLRSSKFFEKFLFENLKKLLNIFPVSFKSKILTNSYYQINTNNAYKSFKVEGILNEDGHPQLSPNKRFIIYDTYSNTKNFQKLLLYDLLTKKNYEIGEFYLAQYLTNSNLKYDLHPRWDNSGYLISIDSSHENSRQTYVINIENLIKSIS
ncbi:hypothetical protein OA845_01825 [Candidatus Pelagibacter sp.]|nr:hypothetical protein [Candidatus Pelagibacter sp.]